MNVNTLSGNVVSGNITARDMGQLGEQIASLKISRRSAVNKVLDELAKRAVFKVLKNIKNASLIIEDGGENHNFGDDDAALSARVVVKNSQVYRKFAYGGNLGGGEAYMLGHWDSPNLTDVIRVLSLNIEILTALEQSKSLFEKMALRSFQWLNNNTVEGSRKNISAHYDLGNDFFELFLDKTMMYSSGVFGHPDDNLYQASVNKLDLVCQKLQLNKNDHLVEIGTGWGGLAIHAATHYDCKVTTTTISQQQYEYAHAQVKALGLEDKVKVVLKDYRVLEGSFDKLVSIEMIEAVGQQHYKSYFEKCSSLLKDDGLMLIQAITIPDKRYAASLKSVDFIQKYIFPGGRLPSNAVINENLSRHSNMEMIDLQDIGRDYAKTLHEWRKGFIANSKRVRQQGFNDTFIRMWDYYLCYCEGAFEERAISTVQLLIAKPGFR